MLGFVNIFSLVERFHLREIISLSADYNFHVIDVENLRQHYKMTLLHWYKNFEDHLDEISKMFDERFIRMWRMYLFLVLLRLIMELLIFTKLF